MDLADVPVGTGHPKAQEMTRRVAARLQVGS